MGGHLFPCIPDAKHGKGSLLSWANLGCYPSLLGVSGRKEMHRNEEFFLTGSAGAKKRAGAALVPEPKDKDSAATTEPKALYPVVSTIMGWSVATAIRMAKRYAHIGQKDARCDGSARKNRNPGRVPKEVPKVGGGGRRRGELTL